MTVQDLVTEVLVYCTLFNLSVLFGTYVSVSFIAQIIRYRFFHPLKEFPGPFWWSVTRLPLAWHNFWDTEIAAERALIAKYGKIVRISPTLLLVSTAETLPTIYTKKAVKTPHYTLFSFGFEPTVFHMLEHEDYAQRAKMVAGIYSTRAHMPSTEQKMDSHNLEWIEKLKSLYVPTVMREGMSFNLAKWVQFLTMDVIIDLALGGFANDNDLGFVANGKDMLNLCWGFKIALPFYGVVCRLHPFVNWLNQTWFGIFFNFFMLHIDPLIGNQMRFIDRALKARLREVAQGDVEKKGDMMQSFIDARTRSGVPMTTTTLRGEILIVLMAGADNTTAAICTTLHHILSSPSALARVMFEINTALSSGAFSSTPQFSEILAHCPFYVACVKESLRLNPPLPSFIPRYSPSDSTLVVHGREIPPNVEIASNPWITQRDPDIYGEDAEEWKAERWLDPERARVMEKYSFVFGYGSRLCLGRQLGWMSAVKVPLMFLKGFETELLEEEGKKAHVTVRADFSYWEDFKVKVVARM